jgi:hypothetical protein
MSPLVAWALLNRMYLDERFVRRRRTSLPLVLVLCVVPLFGVGLLVGWSLR